MRTQPPGTYRLYDPPWYPPCARAAVRSWLANDPNFAKTFRQRILEEKDRQFWHSLILRMYDSCPADQLPEHPLLRDELQTD